MTAFIRLAFRDRLFNLGESEGIILLTHLNPMLGQMFVFCLGIYKVQVKKFRA
jgi:hypothetical protein